MKDLNFQNLVRITVFLVFAIAFFFILIVGQNIIVPLIIAFFVAFLLLPVCRFLERFRMPRVWAAIMSLLLVLVVLTGVGFFFGSQIGRFTDDLDQIEHRFAALKGSLPLEAQQWFDETLNNGLYPFIEENLGGIFKGLSAFASSFTFVFIVPIYIVLILIYRDVFREFMYRVFDNIHGKTDSKGIPGDESGIRHLLPRIQSIVQQYILGMFYVICILFVLNSIALISLGIEHAILFAAFAAVLNIIPFVGPLLGSTLPILFALVTKDSLWYPALVLIAFIVIQTAESNLITPNIVGRNVSLNPLTTLVTLFVGAAVWGVVGMVLFIPLVAVLKEVIGNIPGLKPYAYVLGTGEQAKKEDGFWSRLENKLEKLKNRTVK